MIDNYLQGPQPTSFHTVKHILADGLPRPLPRRVMEWLAVNGGSAVRPEIPMPDPQGNALLVEFFTAGRIIDNYRSKGSFGEVLPSNFVMVGYGPGGGVCIDTGDERFGSVWFADFDLAAELIPDDGSTSDEMMLLLARNWDEFLMAR